MGKTPIALYLTSGAAALRQELTRKSREPRVSFCHGRQHPVPKREWLYACRFLRARFMLQKLVREIRECYRHATVCSRSADQRRDLLTKQDFLDMEKRRLRLARGYAFAERLLNLIGPSESQNGKEPDQPMAQFLPCASCE
jgi:hypothetical protein